MPTEEPRRLRAVYAGALERDPEERDEYLTRACAGDPELRARVVALLERHSRDFVADTDAVSPTDTTKTSAVAGAVEGRRIGPYIVRRELGRGGMSVVYLADDTRLARPVALKAIPPDVGRNPTNRERLRLEARAAASLCHPGIATVYALEEFDQDLYLAYEYVPGKPLRALLTAGPLPFKQVVTIGAQLARGLAAAHAAGVIHRDIKPENVMQTPTGVVKILDFGLARVAGAPNRHLTQTGTVVGTPAYMAPEQLLGQPVDFRTDLFAFGVLLYELASGKNPFAAEDINQTFVRIVHEEPPTLSTVCPASASGLDLIVATCLRKDPRERYQSTGDLVADFEELESARAQRHLSSTGADRGRSLPAAREADSARWWWEFHQLAVCACYILMIYPAWYARLWLGQPWTLLFLMTILVTATMGTSLRLHLRFTSRHAASELPWRLSTTRRWMRISDIVWAGTQLAAATWIGAAHPEVAMLLVVAATALLIATMVIEPTTERAAFASARSNAAEVPPVSGGGR